MMCIGDSSLWTEDTHSIFSRSGIAWHLSNKSLPQTSEPTLRLAGAQRTKNTVLSVNDLGGSEMGLLLFISSSFFSYTN